jgi:hypothetical protein
MALLHPSRGGSLTKQLSLMTVRVSWLGELYLDTNEWLPQLTFQNSALILVSPNPPTAIPLFLDDAN